MTKDASGLFITAAVLSVGNDRGAGGDRLLARMALAGVPVLLVGDGDVAEGLGPIADRLPSPVTARLFLFAARSHGLDLGTSWLLAADRALAPMAATAGFAGLVLLDGEAPTEDDGLLIAHARSLGDAPRVMLPRGGGCWHDHQQK